MREIFTRTVLAGALAALIAIPAFGQDPAGQSGSQQPNPTMSQGSQSGSQSGSTDTSMQSGSSTTQGQSTDQSTSQDNQSSTTNRTNETSFGAGQEKDVEGYVVSRDADTLTMLTKDNQTVTVAINDQTQVKEKKSNPFRGAKKYPMTSLVPGLRIEVEGRADNSGRLVAEKIKTRDDDLRTAQAIETRVNPVEKGLAETRQNAERMSGQIQELNAVSNAARGGAVAAQESADRAASAAQRAQSSADEANTGVRAANERIVSLDNYDIKTSAVVNFKVNSSRLSPDAKTKLDDIAQQFSNETGYMVEIVGFASADGGTNYNRQLSQRRADSVVRYLAEEHNVPLRRIVTPFGYGELQPVADNSTRAGREQNRRVEVRLLINRGLHGQSAGMQNQGMEPQNTGGQMNSGQMGTTSGSQGQMGSSTSGSQDQTGTTSGESGSNTSGTSNPSSTDSNSGSSNPAPTHRTE